MSGNPQENTTWLMPVGSYNPRGRGITVGGCVNGVPSIHKVGSVDIQKLIGVKFFAVLPAETYQENRE